MVLCYRQDTNFFNIILNSTREQNPTREQITCSLNISAFEE